MNLLLWILQILLAVHTAIGAVWKFSNSAEQTMSSLAAIPQGIWRAMGVLELLLAVSLILPALARPLAVLAPVAAATITAEMLLYTVIHLASGAKEHGPLAYWLAVAAIAAFVAVGRFAIHPIT